MASCQIFLRHCSVWGDLGKTACWMLQKLLGICVNIRDVCEDAQEIPGFNGGGGVLSLGGFGVASTPVSATGA